MIHIGRTFSYRGIVLVALGALGGALFVVTEQEVRGQKGAGILPVSRRTPAESPSADSSLRQSPGAVASGPLAGDYGLGSSHVSQLEPYPQPCLEGMRTPFDLWRYAGKGRSSLRSPQLPTAFGAWPTLHRAPKAQLTAQ